MRRFGLLIRPSPPSRARKNFPLYFLLLSPAAGHDAYTRLLLSPPQSVEPVWDSAAALSYDPCNVSKSSFHAGAKCGSCQCAEGVKEIVESHTHGRRRAMDEGGGEERKESLEKSRGLIPPSPFPLFPPPLSVRPKHFSPRTVHDSSFPHVVHREKKGCTLFAYFAERGEKGCLSPDVSFSRNVIIGPFKVTHVWRVPPPNQTKETFANAPC